MHCLKMWNSHFRWRRQINLFDLSKYLKGSATDIIIYFRPIVWVLRQLVAMATQFFS